MRHNTLLVLLLILSINSVYAADNTTTLSQNQLQNPSQIISNSLSSNNISNNSLGLVSPFPGLVATSSLNNSSAGSNLTDPINENILNEKGAKNFQAGSDMVAYALTDTAPKRIGDSIFEQFGGIRAWVAKFYTWNIKPWQIPGVEEFYKNNQLLVFPFMLLYMMGFTVARNVAIANPQLTTDVFGNTNWAYKDYIGGGLFMIIGAFFGGLFYLIMVSLDIINMYLLLQVMSSIEPSVNTAWMYFCLGIITIFLFVFFIYRQMWIVAGYAVSPFYGVLFASGTAKNFIDSIGEAFLRAIMMQPLSILITVVWLVVIKGISYEMWGTTVWKATDAGLPYLSLFIILLAGCCWCVWGKFTLVKRVVGSVIGRGVHI
jgi:hypothetical protein